MNNADIDNILARAYVALAQRAEVADGADVNRLAHAMDHVHNAQELARKVVDYDGE